MKLIKFRHRKDFGDDWYTQILTINDWSLLQVSISWFDEPIWPYIQIKSGNGSTLSILFWAHRFGLDFDFLSRTWRWDCMDDVDFINEDLK